MLYWSADAVTQWDLFQYAQWLVQLWHSGRFGVGGGGSRNQKVHFSVSYNMGGHPHLSANRLCPICLVYEFNIWPVHTHCAFLSDRSKLATV